MNDDANTCPGVVLTQMGLTQKQIQVLASYFYDNAPASEIAEQMGISVQAAYQIIERGKAAIEAAGQHISDVRRKKPKVFYVEPDKLDKRLCR